jgi:hypothetical protein
MGQLSFFDADKRLTTLSAKGDPLEIIDRMVPVLGESIDLSRGIDPFRDKADSFAKCIHTAEHCQHAICLKWRCAQLAVKLGHHGARKLVGFHGAKLRDHDAIEQVAIERGGFRLAFRLHMLGKKARCQFCDVGHGARAGFVGRRVFSVRHGAENGLRSLSGGLRRDLPNGPYGEPPGWRGATSARSVDDDISFCAGGTNANAKAGQLSIPRRVFFRPNDQAINKPLRDPLAGHLARYTSALARFTAIVVIVFANVLTRGACLSIAAAISRNAAPGLRPRTEAPCAKRVTSAAIDPASFRAFAASSTRISSAGSATGAGGATSARPSASPFWPVPYRDREATTPRLSRPGRHAKPTRRNAPAFAPAPGMRQRPRGRADCAQ